MAIVSYTLSELKKMKSLSDWERVHKMKEEDIDYSDAPDLAELIDKGLVHEVRSPFKKYRKKPISIRLDGFTLEKLRKSGKNWQTKLSDKISLWVDKGMK
jgi:uncharacterized protein (DUF4415 family)